MNFAQAYVEVATVLLRLKIRKPVSPGMRTHFADLFRMFPELLKGKSIPVYQDSNIPGRESWTVTNERGTDVAINPSTDEPFRFTEDQVQHMFELVKKTTAQAYVEVAYTKPTWTNLESLLLQYKVNGFAEADLRKFALLMKGLAKPLAALKFTPDQTYDGYQSVVLTFTCPFTLKNKPELVVPALQKLKLHFQPTAAEQSFRGAAKFQNMKFEYQLSYGGLRIEFFMKKGADLSLTYHNMQNRMVLIKYKNGPKWEFCERATPGQVYIRMGSEKLRAIPIKFVIEIRVATEAEKKGATEKITKLHNTEDMADQMLLIKFSDGNYWKYCFRQDKYKGTVSIAGSGSKMRDIPVKFVLQSRQPTPDEKSEANRVVKFMNAYKSELRTKKQMMKPSLW
jgi:hypothetical protein